MDDYYEIFHIPIDSTQDEIKLMYKHYCKEFHPDNRHSADAHKEFTAIQNAFEILLDPDSRELYDAQLKFFYRKKAASEGTKNTDKADKKEMRYKEAAVEKSRKPVRNVNDITSVVYDRIEQKATSNVYVQGISGLFGFPFTLMADAAVIVTHYTPMLNEIREIYGRQPIQSENVGPLIKNILNEVLFDLVTDKILGQIPGIGIYFNAICAKTMTWRLGILFSMLSSRGESIDNKSLKGAMILIRKMFPQEDAFKFKQPDYATFIKLVTSVYDNSEEDYAEKINKALNVFGS